MAKKRTGIMTFRLPEDEKAQLAYFADQMDQSLSDLAVRACRQMIAELNASMMPSTPVEKESPKTKAKKK
jgi:3-oxoacyl-[acyl-carrier-protein] synthase III